MAVFTKNCTSSVRSKEIVKNQETEPSTEPRTLREACIRMLPHDFNALIGGTARIGCVIVAFIDYLHTRDLDRFLLLSGIALGGYSGVEQGMKYLAQKKGTSSHKPNNGELSL